jgi:hypothetical protein
MDILYNYKILGNIPLSYWTIKNHQEMEDWIIKHSPFHFPSQFLPTLVELELVNLIQLKRKHTKINFSLR